VITGKNAGQIKCRILAEAANGPTTPDADRILEKRWDEIFLIPDILCNAGGVIVSYFEWVQGLQAFLWTESEVTDKLFRILEHSFAQVIRRAKEHEISHRTAAMAIGVERVIKAKQVRGLFPKRGHVRALQISRHPALLWRILKETENATKRVSNQTR
jgi:glutamate dehydrogenase (NAD(P)+)